MNLTLTLLLALIPPAVEGMGAPAWRVRERATAALYHLTPLALPALEAAEKDANAERARRAALLIERYYWSNADSLSRQLSLPPIDLLPDGTKDRFCVVQNYLDAAYASLERERTIEVWRRWFAHSSDGSEGSHPLEVRIEATRLYLVPVIARRGDVRAALLPLWREAVCRGCVPWRSR